jgi:RNA polymerase sigma-70 factor, ECF subfamily
MLLYPKTALSLHGRRLQLVNRSTTIEDGGPDAASLFDRASGGDANAWGALLAQHQERLQYVLAFRLDPRLRGRVDAADVVQDAFIVATARRADFFAQSQQPLFLWLRWIAANTLLELHRHHLGTQMRDAAREVSWRRRQNDDETRAALMAQLTGGATGPATAAGRAEARACVSDALARMERIDREVLALRHFEQLTNAEAAQVLGIEERAAGKRYVRALERMREVLSTMPGGLTGLRP